MKVTSKLMTLRLLGVIGGFLFGVLVLATFATPQWIEDSAKGFIKAQIEKEVRSTYEAVGKSTVAQKALAMAESFGYEQEQLQEDLNNNLPQIIANQLAAMCGYDCEKKKQMAASITSNYLERLQRLEIAQVNLANIIKDKYLEIVSNLKLDLRIFLASNFSMFLILFGASFAKPRAALHLFLPGMLLLLATAASSSIYIFGQDWFYTILYNDYMGFAYLAYIAFIFAILMDITFNKATITTEIINAIANAIGSAFTVSPC